MTLKEKFTERLYNQSHDDSECLRIRFENIDKVINSQEKIADEFTIGFAEWIIQLLCSHIDSLAHQLYTDNDVTQLLEIYKKEKET